MTNNLFIIFLFSILAFYASEAKSADYVDRYEEQLSLYERTLQFKYNEFKLVRNLPAESKTPGSVKFDVSTSPQEAIATLHDLKTGAPLMSCVTPCELKGNGKKTYRIVYFKDGYLPSYHPVTPHVRKRLEYPPYKLVNYNKMTEKYDVCDSKMSKWMSKDRPKPVACAKRSSNLPAKTVRSGNCEVAFDLSDDGYPRNVAIKSCSERLFEDNSLAAAVWWRFYPQIQNGQTVAADNIFRDFKYILHNSKGKEIPAKK